VVSGVLALMFSANEQLTAEDARAVLNATADMVQVETAAYDSDGWSEVYGYGRVNATSAVLTVANTGPEAPEPIGPIGDPYADRVVLQWNPASDADGDPLRYAVSLAITSPISEDTDNGDTGDTGDTEADDTGGEAEASPEPVLVNLDNITETMVDITDQVAAGDQVEWTVRATDAWTTSAAVEAPMFMVLEIPEPPEEPEPEPEPEPDTAVPGATDAPAQADANNKDVSGCATAGSAGAGLSLVLMGMARRRRSRPEHLTPGEVDPRTDHPTGTR
jgi:hypothetical protein